MEVSLATPLQIKAAQEHRERRRRLGLIERRQILRPVIVKTPEPEPTPPPKPKVVIPEPLDLLTDIGTAAVNARFIVKVICNAASSVFFVDTKDILGKRRIRQIARARQAAFYVARTVTGWSYPEVGRRFGGKDHTTVLHGVRVVRRRMQADSDHRERIDKMFCLSRYEIEKARPLPDNWQSLADVTASIMNNIKPEKDERADNDRADEQCA